MELDRVIIQNFRSVKSAVLKFDHNCMVLVGKNEAGKSNILKAIAAVFGAYSVTNKDRRKKIDNEKIAEYFVQAVFILNEGDIKEVAKRFNKKFFNANLVRFKGSNTLTDFIRYVFCEFLIELDIADKSKPFFTYWEGFASEFSFDRPLYIDNNSIYEEQFDRDPLDLGDELLTIVIELYQENSVRCNYWQYDNSQLLPSSVDIEQFISRPYTVKALENIFIMCGREEVKDEFDNAMLEDGDYANLLEQLSQTTTQIFQKIWKDFKGTQIQLQQNGTEILIKVANKAKYSFEDRSDGFKKFISILLMLSTQSRANKLKDRDLILIDEPDQSLYPTSARFLRDELLEMSKKSKIIYSTHSQYMIDSSTIDRHIIVEKIDDITQLTKQESNASYSSDELLLNAIGSSIFECLKTKNLIFEGYLDKALFDKYCAFYKKGNDFKDYGMVYLGGISGAETLVQLLMLANKKFVIVADSDETSKNKRVDFAKNYPAYKDNWLAYGDVCNTISTMEDFLSNDAIEVVLKKSDTAFVFDGEKNAIQNIEKVVAKDKEKKQAIKNELMKDLKKEQIKDEYNNYLEKLKDKLDSL